MTRQTFADASVCIVASIFLLFSVPQQTFAQNQVRKPYPDPIVVEEAAVIISLKQQATRWRPSLEGKPGFYSWRLDVNATPALGIVLAADTMMRVTTLSQIVNGSSLRRCPEKIDIAARSCTMVLHDTVGVNGNYVQIILRDTSIVDYFRGVRPGSIRSTTFDPHGRFHLERLRVLYRDFPKRD